MGNLNLKSSVKIWNTYGGALMLDTSSGATKNHLFGFETFSRYFEDEIYLPPGGTYFGFVSAGHVMFRNRGFEWTLHSGQWVSWPGDLVLHIAPDSRLNLIWQEDYIGFFQRGGSVEIRRSFENGYADSTLMAPPLVGDPYLSLLYFPPGTDQVKHANASARMGMIVSGRGECHLENEILSLYPGQIFYVPPNTPHWFATPARSAMSVFTFQPDSDWGPIPQTHPRIRPAWAIAEKYVS